MGHGSAICARGIFAGFSLSSLGGSDSDSGILFSVQSGAAPVKVLLAGKPWFGSEVQLEWNDQHSGSEETEKERAQTPQSFPNNCKPPPAWTSAAADHLLGFPPKVLIQLRTPGPPLVLPGTCVGHSGFGV